MAKSPRDSYGLLYSLQQIQSAKKGGGELDPKEWNSFFFLLSADHRTKRSELLEALLWCKLVEWEEPQRSRLSYALEQVLYGVASGFPDAEGVRGSLITLIVGILIFVPALAVLIWAAILLCSSIGLFGQLAIVLFGALFITAVIIREALPTNMRSRRPPKSYIAIAALEVAEHLSTPQMVPPILRCMLKDVAKRHVAAPNALRACLATTTDYSNLQGHSDLLADCRKLILTGSVPVMNMILPMICQIGREQELAAMKRRRNSDVRQRNLAELYDAITKLETKLTMAESDNALLRPAEAPADTLLRPVSSTETDTALLVRPAADTVDDF